jgi:hypothetical protein
VKKNIIFSILTLLFMSSLSVEAKELTNRLGIGVKSHEIVNLSELAFSYHPARDIAVVGGLGVDTKKDESKMAVNVGIRRLVFKEENMNFYMGGNIGYVSSELASSKDSGFELNGVFGGEFFLHGLDSLAFMFEGGAGVLSGSSVRFRTIADNPFRAGIIFYF